jgi:hypothetical protein
VALVPDPAGDELDAIWESEWQQHLPGLARERVKRQASDAQGQEPVRRFTLDTSAFEAVLPPTNQVECLLHSRQTCAGTH